MRAFIMGATSEVAMSLSRKLASANHDLVLAGRDIERLEAVRRDLVIRYSVQVDLLEYDLENNPGIDLTEYAAKTDLFCTLIGYLGEHELALRECEERERILSLNFNLAVHLVMVFANVFEARGCGTIVGVSSAAGERGRASNFVYGSAKAAFSTFLDGLRGHLSKSGVHVIKVVPGFMNTKMIEGLSTPNFLTASPEKAAGLILNAIKRSRNTVYIDWKWLWIMRIIKLIPESLFKRMNL